MLERQKKQIKVIPPISITEEPQTHVEMEPEREKDPVLEHESSPITVPPKEDYSLSQAVADPIQTAIVPPVSQEETNPTASIFGNKLESEYRRESKAESHWIRQDDTEICINIGEAVYKKMVELQSENPKKWVNKELDLYKRAKSLLIEQNSPRKSFFKRK